MAVQTSEHLLPPQKSERIIPVMKEAEMQTSEKQKKSDPPKSAREERISPPSVLSKSVREEKIVSNPVVAVPPPETEGSVSPQKMIDLQLEEIERKQDH